MLERYSQATLADLDSPLNDWDFDGGRGLLLYGPKGTGKTHAAVALRDAAMQSMSLPSSFAPYVSLARLMQEKRRAMNVDTGWREPDWRSVRFVVFDDWDKLRWSEWVAEEMFGIVDTLYCRMIPVVITSNLRPRDFARHSGQYVADRVKEMCVPVELAGVSRRMTPA